MCVVCCARQTVTCWFDFFPWFSFWTRFPPSTSRRTDPTESDSTSSVARFVSISLARVTHTQTHLLTSRTHTVAYALTRGRNWQVLTHTRKRAGAHTHTRTVASRSRTHSRTGCQNIRAVRFSAGCSSDPRKLPQTPSRHRCEGGRHVDVMIDMIRRPIVAAIPVGHHHLEGAPSSWTAAMDHSAAAVHTSNERYVSRLSSLRSRII